MSHGVIAQPIFVLIHSPLVGTSTWVLVAQELESKGFTAVVPTLTTTPGKPPYWKQHVDAIAEALGPIPADLPLILVGHSGAGILLPLVREITLRPVAVYVFVDALVPEDGKSGFDLFESQEAVEEFRRAAEDGFLPVWSEEDLKEHIPDPDLRRLFVAELRPLPLAVYEEPIPVFTGWPDASCAYLKFSEVYRPEAEKAKKLGWAYMEMDALHFHMLVDAVGVTGAILELVAQTGISLESE